MGDKQSLRAISEELLTIMDQAENATDPGEYDLVAKMDELTEKLNGKMDGVLDYIFKLMGDVEGISVKINYLSKAREVKQKRIDKLQNYIKLVLSRQGIVEMDTSEHLIRLAKNPPKVDITSEADIPKEYFRYKLQTVKPIKDYVEYMELQKQPAEDGVVYKFTDDIDKVAIKAALST